MTASTGVYNGASLPTLSPGQRSDLQTDSRAQLKVVLGTLDSVTGVTSNNWTSDGQSVTSQGIYVQSRGYVFNGATADRQRGDTNGIVSQRALGVSSWNFASAAGGLTTTADTVMSAATVGVRNYCTGLSFANSSAVASEIVIKDGATTVLFRGFVPATTANTVTIPFDIPLRGSVNTDMTVAMIITGTSTRVSAQGFQGS